MKCQLVIPVDKILMQIKDDPQLQWLRLLNSSPNAQDKRRCYHFHQDYGHYTDECRDLKEQIEDLIQKEGFKGCEEKHTRST